MPELSIDCKILNRKKELDMNICAYRRSGILKIQTLKSCASVTVNGNGNSLSNSFTITLPAADTPNHS